MSVLVTMRIAGDTEKFREFMTSGADRLRAIRDAAKAGGCLHHRFGVGDGYVLVVDEWESEEAFQAFFADNPDLPGVMQDAGAQGPPELTFLHAVESPDQF
jgi:heme-degrading monooxygenase HmoA